MWLVVVVEIYIYIYNHYLFVCCGGAYFVLQFTTFMTQLVCLSEGFYSCIRKQHLLFEKPKNTNAARVLTNCKKLTDTGSKNHRFNATNIKAPHWIRS